MNRDSLSYLHIFLHCHKYLDFLSTGESEADLFGSGWVEFAYYWNTPTQRRKNVKWVNYLVELIFCDLRAFHLNSSVDKRNVVFPHKFPLCKMAPLNILYVCRYIEFRPASTNTKIDAIWDYMSKWCRRNYFVEFLKWWIMELCPRFFTATEFCK